MTKQLIKSTMKDFNCLSHWFDGWDYEFVKEQDILAVLEQKARRLIELDNKGTILTPAEYGVIYMVNDSPLFGV